MSQEPLTPKETLEHAWRYFSLHGTQRMSLFNYFLILFTLVAAGLAGCLRADGPLRAAGIALGLALAGVALAFWKLDQRTGFLIKHAEKALRELEAMIPLESARLLSREPDETKKAQLEASGIARMWTYGQSFRRTFFVAGLVGLSGALVSLALVLGWLGPG